MADLCQASGAKALVCCPLVSEKKFTEDEQVQETSDALKNIPILKSRGLLGHLETLGFPISSFRKKELALKAIDEAGVSDVFDLLHDKFHQQKVQRKNIHCILYLTILQSV